MVRDSARCVVKAVFAEELRGSKRNKNDVISLLAADTETDRTCWYETDGRRININNTGIKGTVTSESEKKAKAPFCD
jgi:hypothetical protein